jgi:tetratricopeptide (TPR) repeat protein
MKKLLYLSLTAFLLTSGSPMTFAAGEGGGGGGSSGGGMGAQEVRKCKKGDVIKKVKVSGALVKKCVKVQSGVLPDDDLYEQGRILAKSGEYEWALQVLAAIQNQNDPRVLNMSGYSNRKAGRLEIGITYYRKALAIDPNFVLAREYLGEGYVAAGRIDLAKFELNEIKNRAGVNSEEYRDLSKAITTGVIEAD